MSTFPLSSSVPYSAYSAFPMSSSTTSCTLLPLVLLCPCLSFPHTAQCAFLCLTLPNVPYSALQCMQYYILHTATLLHTLLCSYYAFYNTAYCTQLTVFYSAHCVKLYILCILHSAYLKARWHTVHPCCNAQSLHIFLQRLHAGVGGG